MGYDAAVEGARHADFEPDAAAVRSTMTMEKVRNREAGVRPEISPALAESLYAQSGAARWGMDAARFTECLRESAARHVGESGAGRREIENYLKALRLEDLALAAACAAGEPRAWDYFVAHYREQLHAAARAIVGAPRNAERARELADSLYADLYGLPGATGARRKPLFAYFHGRSKLSTWLRAVLSQRYVDLLRAERRNVAIEEVSEAGELRVDGEQGAQAARPATRAATARPAEPRDPDRARYLALLQAALHDALDSVSAEDRARLRAYYLDSCTLAEIARARGEHEATASRHLERCRRELRECVERSLREGQAPRDGRAPRSALSAAQVALCFEYAVEDWAFDLKSALDRGSGEKMQDNAPETFKG